MEDLGRGVHCPGKGVGKVLSVWLVKELVVCIITPYVNSMGTGVGP